MTTVAPRTVVAAPPHVRVNVGSLLTTATVTRGTDRWAGGIAYQPELANTGDTLDPCAVGDANIPATPETVEWDPYVIWVGDECSTLSGDYTEIRRRVETALTAQESHLIEQVLWTNTVDSVDFGATHPNVSLADAAAATPNGTTPVGLTEGISDMVAALTTALGGARGMIHVSPRLIPYLVFYNLATRNGNLLQVSGTDHLIVAGTGYTGSDPNGVTYESWDWIYGTSPVEVYVGDTTVVPGSEREAVDRTTNDVAVRAAKPALAHWDRTAHIGIPVCIPDPGPDCSPSGS